MLASPIKWVGGKSKLRSQVIDLIPPAIECYCEPFAGAVWVLFGKYQHPVEVINDADGDLINLWRVIKWRPAELLEEIHGHLYSRAWFYELREHRPDTPDELQRAVWMYLMIQMAFGASLDNLPSASFGYRKQQAHKESYFLQGSLLRIEPAAERLRGVFIESGDFAKVIDRYDQPRSFFFCDPPYHAQSGYSEGFSYEDHRRLSLVLKQIAGRFLLTINDHQEVRQLYNGCYVMEANEARTISRETEGRQAAPILFIANYPLGNDGTLQDERTVIEIRQQSLF